MQAAVEGIIGGVTAGAGKVLSKAAAPLVSKAKEGVKAVVTKAGTAIKQGTDKIVSNTRVVAAEVSKGIKFDDAVSLGKAKFSMTGSKDSDIAKNFREVIGMGGSSGKAAAKGEQQITSNGALKQAKRMLVFQEASNLKKLKRVPMTTSEPSGSHVIKDSNGKIIHTKEYTYTNTKGEKIVIQNHSAGHADIEQGPHANVRPVTDTRNRSVPGTKDHYPITKKK